jgi:hypothetical protein
VDQLRFGHRTHTHVSVTFRVVFIVSGVVIVVGDTEMGKLKSRRQARPKVEEPTGLPSVKSEEEEEAETLSIPLKPSAQNTLPALIHEVRFPQLIHVFITLRKSDPDRSN